MKLEFQQDLLKFLVQNKEAKRYIEVLEEDVFDLDTHYTVFGLLKSFVKKYRSQPTLGNFLEYFDRELKQQTKKNGENFDDIYRDIEETIREAFYPITANVEQIREVILEEYQIKLLKDLFVQEAGNLKTANSETVSEIYRKIAKIKNIGESDMDEEQNKGIFALQEFTTSRKSMVSGTPTYLRALNRMTSTGGFYAPQLIILMGAPKSFKTGTLINIAMNLVRDGKKVYYVDCENGESRILDKFYQSMLRATWQEYTSGELDETLEEMVRRFKVMGGDFISDFYPAQTKTVADVEERLKEIEQETGWKPDVIMWDYPDLLEPTNFKIIEKRLKIQAIYFDIIRLHKRRDIWGMGLSQVNKDAVDKPVIDMKGFAEDFGKAANCHAAFALCRTPEEKEVGLMRIVPVVQRDGVAQHSHNACYTEVKEGSMSVVEVEKDYAAALLKTVEKPAKKVLNKAFKPRNVKDE